MRIILAIFTDRFEVYGSLKPFFEQYPQYTELKGRAPLGARGLKLFGHIITALTQIRLSKKMKLHYQK